MGTQQDAVPRRSTAPSRQRFGWQMAGGFRWCARPSRAPSLPRFSPPRLPPCIVYRVAYRGSRTTGSEWDGFSEESVFMAARGEGQVQPPGQEAGGTRRASSSATEPVRACGELGSRAPRDAPAGPREGLAQPSRWLWARPRFLRAGRRLSGEELGVERGLEGGLEPVSTSASASHHI